MDRMGVVRCLRTARRLRIQGIACLGGLYGPDFPR